MSVCQSVSKGYDPLSITVMNTIHDVQSVAMGNHKVGFKLALFRNEAIAFILALPE